MALVLLELTVQPGETNRQWYKKGQVLGRGWCGEIRQWPQKGPWNSKRASWQEVACACRCFSCRCSCCHGSRQSTKSRVPHGKGLACPQSSECLKRGLDPGQEPRKKTENMRGYSQHIYNTWRGWTKELETLKFVFLKKWNKRNYI